MDGRLETCGEWKRNLDLSAWILRTWLPADQLFQVLWIISCILTNARKGDQSFPNTCFRNARGKQYNQSSSISKVRHAVSIDNLKKNNCKHWKTTHRPKPLVFFVSLTTHFRVHMLLVSAVGVEFELWMERMIIAWFSVTVRNFYRGDKKNQVILQSEQ